MNMNPLESLQKILAHPGSVLILPGKQSGYDSLSAALALAFVFELQNKKVRIYYPGTTPDRLSFLNFQKYTISHITDRWDAFVVLGAHSGEVKQMSAVHPHIPILSIAGEESKQTTQLVDSYSPQKNSSVSEKVTHILKDLGEEHITPDVASALLTGIITTTQNFQSPKLHPQTMFTAAYLISKKATNEKIARHLYKTKPIELIRLWGAVIARFAHNKEKGLGWSFITFEDMQATGAQQNHIVRIINELKNNFAQAELFVLGVEEAPGKRYAIIHSTKHSRILRIASLLGATVQNSSIAVPLGNKQNIKEETLALLRTIEIA